MEPQSLQTTVMHGLLDRVRTGDESAFETLLSKLAAPLDQIARRMLKRFPRVARWSDAEDVIQNASLRLVRALREVRPDSMRALYALATTQIRRELLDMAKSYFGKEGLGANYASVAGSESAAGLPDPETGTEDAEFAKWVRFHEEVEKLPTDEREVVGLTFYHGLTQPEIAELLQISERTVQRRWQSAVARLRQVLGQWSAP